MLDEEELLNKFFERISSVRVKGLQIDVHLKSGIGFRAIAKNEQKHLKMLKKFKENGIELIFES